MSASNAGRVAVVGASGSGKSTYAKRLMQKEQRVVILDVMDEYKEIGAKPCYSIAELQAVMRANFNKFRLAYVPPSGSEETALNRLSHLCLKAQEPYKGKRSGKQLTVIVEEMNTCFGLKRETKVPAFAEICARGRHSFIHVVGVSQRFAEISTRFRGNLTECVVFCQQGKADVEAAIGAIGLKANKDQILALDQLEYLHSVRGKITPGKLKFK